MTADEVAAEAKSMADIVLKAIEAYDKPAQKLAVVAGFLAGIMANVVDARERLRALEKLCRPTAAPGSPEAN
jgi:hypothetical protein